MAKPRKQDMVTFYAEGGKGNHVLLGDDEHREWLTPLIGGVALASFSLQATCHRLLTLAIPSGIGFSLFHQDWLFPPGGITQSFSWTFAFSLSDTIGISLGLLS